MTDMMHASPEPPSRRDEVRPLTVSDDIDTLAAEAERLYHLADLIETRFGPVLRSEDTRAMAAELSQARDPGRSLTSDRLADVTARLRQAAMRFDGVLARADLPTT